MTANVMHVPLSKGFVALVDGADYERVMAHGPWHVWLSSARRPYARRVQRTGYGYRARDIGIGLHNFLTGWKLVDHINGDGLDNRRANLRAATPAQNAANQRLSSRSTSGFKGVTRQGSRWRAYIAPGGRTLWLGTFDSPEAAARAYDEAAIEHFGEFARTNFPREEYAS